MTFRNRPVSASGTWIVVANRGRARILSLAEPAQVEPEEVVSMEHAESTQLMHEQVSDRQGYFRGRSGSLDSGDPETDHQHRMAQQFAAHLVTRLEEGRQQGEFGHLILVAAPMFLGVLKSQLSSPLRQLVERTVDRDYTALSPPELRERLAQLVDA